MNLKSLSFLVAIVSTNLFVSEGAVSKHNTHLEDLVIYLQKQKWNSEQKKCLEVTIQILRNVSNFTLWASWAWDAMQVQPLGLLYGSQYQLGNFDQCLEPPWSLKTYPELRTQYCLAHIHIKGNELKREPGGFDPYDTANKYLHTPTKFDRKLTSISWGVCIPASCNTESVTKILSALLSRSQLTAATSTIHIDADHSCQVAGAPRQYTFGFYMFFALLLSLIATALFSSYFYDSSDPHAPSKSAAISFKDVIRCFSLQENFKKLVKKEAGEIVILNGIRVLTAVIVVLMHYPLLNISAYITFNGIGFEKMFESEYRWITHLDLIVDTFFMMAGLLLVKSLVPKLGTQLENPLMQLFKRYVRLAPTFAVIVFFISTVFWHTGSGPIWPSLAPREVNTCRRNWWLSLLMVNNYINSNEQCFVISWSIPSDYHFTILGTFLFHLYNRQRKLGVTVYSALLFASLVLPGIYTYTNRYPHAVFSSIRALRDIRNNEAFNTMYIASHMRMSTYLIGMVIGYFISVCNPNHYKKIIPQSWSILGTGFGVGLLMLVLHLGTGDRSPLGSALCSSLNRPLWAVGVIILVMCCLYGTVPIVNSFLCWDVFRPLSRLTYGVYLVHSVIVMRNIFSSRAPYFFDFFKALNEALGVLAVSYVISSILWMLVESPASNLYNLCIKGSSPRTVPDTDIVSILGKHNETSSHKKD